MDAVRHYLMQKSLSVAVENSDVIVRLKWVSYDYHNSSVEMV